MAPGKNGVRAQERQNIFVGGQERKITAITAIQVWSRGEWGEIIPPPPPPVLPMQLGGNEFKVELHMIQKKGKVFPGLHGDHFSS